MTIDVELTSLRAQQALAEHAIAREEQAPTNGGKLTALRAKLAAIVAQIAART